MRAELVVRLVQRTNISGRQRGIWQFIIFRFLVKNSCPFTTNRGRLTITRASGECEATNSRLQSDCTSTMPLQQREHNSTLPYVPCLLLAPVISAYSKLAQFCDITCAYSVSQNVLPCRLNINYTKSNRINNITAL